MKNEGCPFCGAGGRVDTLNRAVNKPWAYRMVCAQCEAGTRWAKTPEEAWELWNRRVRVKAAAEKRPVMKKPERKRK